MPWVATAAGLGQLTILSTLGQPLLAEVDLISVQKDELATLVARLAPPEAFSQAKIQYSPALVGVRLSIEKRADGKPYIKIISTRPVNEPFIDLLIELSWAQGRLVREYTALIDPPGFAPGAPAAPVAVAPPTTPESKPIAPVAPVAPATAVAPVEPKPALAKAPAASPPSPAASAKTEGTEYLVKRGDTLSRIAANVKPESVTLEQMLVSLYRTNPDAFVGNMSRLKTGKILRVPEKEQIAETTQPEAVKEVRVQAANWNAYRQKLAEAAGETPARESKTAVSGKITTRVEDKAGKEPAKEVLRLSKGDTTAAAPGTAASSKAASPKDRLRMLEEEATAREKALADANERIAQLEKNIKDMQRLLELKGQVPGKPAVQPSVPGVKPDAPKTEQVVKADQAKTEPPKAEPVQEAAKGEVPKAELAPQEKPKPKPTTIVPAPPPPEPEWLDQILDEPLYLAGAGGLLALFGGAGYFFIRRRRAQPDADDAGAREKTAPKLGKAAATMAAAPMAATPGGGEDVDPLAEADLYLNFGRDAQAEEVLKEALQKNPKNEEAQLKLLQIYTGRKDKSLFDKVAKTLHTQTGGAGDNWLKAAAMGYALAPDNAMYEAGKSAPAAALPMAGGSAGTDLDFDLELSATSTPSQTDVEFDVGAAEKTMILQPGELAGMAAAPDVSAIEDITADSGAARAMADSATAAPDFTLDIPAGTPMPAEPDITLDAPADDAEKTNVTGDSAAPMAGMIDFDFDAAAPARAAPAASAVDDAKGYTHDGTIILSPENQDKAAGLSMDFQLDDTAKVGAAPEAKAVDTATAVSLAPEFKLELPDSVVPAAPELKLDDISLNLDDAPKAEAPKTEGGTKDDRWYDVQTKFDLAKAYQEMGDKDGAREILHEVIKEGDAGQQAEAKNLLDSLG